MIFMAVNKVVKGSEVIIDLTSDTVTSSDHIMEGYVGHLADGVRVTGTGRSISATEHIIHFDFEDGTDVDISVYYDSTFVSSAITATTPTTYDSKTVESASLDGVAWYVKSTETWETVWNNSVNYYPDDNADYPYCWISDLGETTIPVGSTWRVTFDGVEYRLTGFMYENNGWIGNPKWGGGVDNGVDVPFGFWITPWGAWSGSANVADVSSHMVKIERLVVS